MPVTYPTAEAVLKAGPGWLGSKRKLAVLIHQAQRAALLETTGKAPFDAIMLDPFAGACSMGLLGKLYGYEVRANDTSPVAEAIGRGLLANDRVRLTDFDLQAALEADGSKRYKPPTKQLVWPDNVREAMSAVCQAADDHEWEQKAWALRALVVRASLLISQWGSPRMTVGNKIREGRLEDLTTGQAKAANEFARPREFLLRSLEVMQQGVFQAKPVTFTKGEATEFIAANPDADVVYLDPPYPATTNYENEYAGVEALLTNAEVKPEASRFSARDGWKFLGEVFDAAEANPVWVLSLGNEAVEVETLEQMMRERGREVSSLTMKHTHLQAIASSQKNLRNLEFVVIGKRGKKASTL